MEFGPCETQRELGDGVFGLALGIEAVIIYIYIYQLLEKLERKNQESHCVS